MIKTWLRPLMQQRNKQISPAALIALKDALSTIYWYKSDLKSFLGACLKNKTILCSLNWNDYKRQIISDLIDKMSEHGDKYFGDLLNLCYEVSSITTFKNLEQLDGGQEKARRAKSAVEHLKK